VYPFEGHAGATARGPALPDDRTREKERLAGPSQAHADELGEEDAKAASDGQ